MSQLTELINEGDYLRRCAFTSVEGIAYAVEPVSRQLRPVYIKRHHAYRGDAAWVSPGSELSFEQKSGFAPLVMPTFPNIEHLRGR